MGGQDHHGQEFVVGHRTPEAVVDEEGILLHGGSLNREAGGSPPPHVGEPSGRSGGQGGHPQLVRGRVPVSRHTPWNITQVGNVVEHFLPQGVLVLPLVRGAGGPAVDVGDVHLGAARSDGGVGPQSLPPVGPQFLRGDGF